MNDEPTEEDEPKLDDRVIRQAEELLEKFAQGQGEYGGLDPAQYAREVATPLVRRVTETMWQSQGVVFSVPAVRYVLFEAIVAAQQGKTEAELWHSVMLAIARYSLIAANRELAKAELVAMDLWPFDQDGQPLP